MNKAVQLENENFQHQQLSENEIQDEEIHERFYKFFYLSFDCLC